MRENHSNFSKKFCHRLRAWQCFTIPPTHSTLISTTKCNTRLLRLLSESMPFTRGIFRSLTALSAKPPDALLVATDPFLAGRVHEIVTATIQQKLPAMFGFREYPQAGGLISYGANLADMYRRVATYVDRILKGAEPADLPIELPTKFELVINLKTATALGLNVPTMLLVRADEVIE